MQSETLYLEPWLAQAGHKTCKMTKKLILKLGAPYFAVGIFWCLFSNAWLAILAYHAQILFWSYGSITKTRGPLCTRMMLLALPAALAGPLLFLLLPYMAQEDLSLWLANHHLSRGALLVLIPYFGLLHPYLEQRHWATLRDHGPISHLLFAGYHMVVLCTLLTGPWLLVCFCVLASVSLVWQQVTRQTNSLAIPVASHMLADLGVAVVAYLAF